VCIGNKEQPKEPEWWERRTQVRDDRVSPVKPHPSQSFADHPRANKKGADETLTWQIEYKQQMEEDRKRKEKEEDERIERKVREQQERMKREYEEEQAKKRAKEEAVN